VADDGYYDDECFNALCGYDAFHNHGPECTTDCPCGEGEESS